jgi:RNA polymerase sigma-70 factor (ECF subfamily)
LDAVLFVLYLMFNEGYHSTGATTAIRKDLCLEAIRLGMLLVDRPDMQAYPQVYALLALMCFHAARFEARIDSKGGLIILEEQDRSLWDGRLIDSGLSFLARSSGGDALSEYHLEAAIAAEHAMAADFLSTDWGRIHYYYTALEALKPSAVVRLNLAIALGKKEGPAAAIPLLHALESSLPGYPLLQASLGEFYFLSGDRLRARGYFSEARKLTRSPAAAEVLDRKIAAC